MKEREIHNADPTEIPIRFQEYGVGIFNSITTKSGLKKAIKKELITINGEKATTSAYIKKGDVIKLFSLEDQNSKRMIDLKLQVHFEDDHLAVVSKPAGIIVSGNKRKTIVNALPFNLKPSSEEDSLPNPLAVHRLDFPTSGLLIVAKTNQALIDLNKMFAANEISKTYHAISLGKMNSAGCIDSSIDGKEAVTKFKVLQTVDSDKFNFLNLVKLQPVSGRRHQLRIHLSRLGNPILGDILYGQEGKILRKKGLYLHASVLQLIHPITGVKLIVKEDLPKKFLKLFKF